MVEKKEKMKKTEPVSLPSRFWTGGFHESWLSLLRVLFRDDLTGSKLQMKAIFIEAKVSTTCFMCDTFFCPLDECCSLVCRVPEIESERKRERGPYALT